MISNSSDASKENVTPASQGDTLENAKEKYIDARVLRSFLPLVAKASSGIDTVTVLALPVDTPKHAGITADLIRVIGENNHFEERPRQEVARGLHAVRRIYQPVLVEGPSTAIDELTKGIAEHIAPEDNQLIRQELHEEVDRIAAELTTPLGKPNLSI